MRVLLTTDTVGGVWTFTQELSAELLRRDHSVALISFGREASPAQLQWSRRTMEQFGSRFCFRSTDAPLEWMEENGSTWVRGSAAISEFLHESNFDPHLIHSSQFCFGEFEVGVPTIVTAHSDVLSWAEACRPEGLPDSSWLQTYLQLVRAGLEQANVVVAPTQWMASTVERLYRMKTEVVTIPNGRSLPTHLGEPKRELRAITAGRLWDEAKGLDTLQGVESPMPIQIAGDQTLAPGSPGAYDPPSECAFLGALGETELLAAFSRSAVYLVLSIYEPFGLAPVEAALCGCAIVARDLPSLREVWGDAALYFADASELQALLVRLAAEPALLAQTQNRCQVRARQYSVSCMVDKYIELYEGVLLNAGWHVDEFKPAPVTAGSQETQHGV